MGLIGSFVLFKPVFQAHILIDSQNVKINWFKKSKTSIYLFSDWEVL